MYASFLDAGMALNDEQFREYVLRLKDYALYGIETTSECPIINSLMMMAEPLLEAAEKRRDKQIKNGAEGGKYGVLGGRPRKGETADEYKARKAIENRGLIENLNETLTKPLEDTTKPLNVNEEANANANEEANVNGNAEAEAKDEVYTEDEHEEDAEMNIFEKNNTIERNNIPIWKIAPSYEDNQEQYQEHHESIEVEKQNPSICTNRNHNNYESRCNDGRKGGGYALTGAELSRIIQEAYEKRDFIVNSNEMDNYTDAANDMLDQDGDGIARRIKTLIAGTPKWLTCQAESRLLNDINRTEGDKQKTARSLIEYYLRREAAERPAAYTDAVENGEQSKKSFLDAITLGAEYDYSGNPVADFAWEQELRMRQKQC